MNHIVKKDHQYWLKAESFSDVLFRSLLLIEGGVFLLAILFVVRVIL